MPGAQVWTDVYDGSHTNEKCVLSVDQSSKIVLFKHAKDKTQSKLKDILRLSPSRHSTIFLRHFVWAGERTFSPLDRMGKPT